MSMSRFATASGAGGALAITFLFACATSVELGREQATEPDAGSDQTLPDAAADERDAAADAIDDVAFDGVVTGACSVGGFCFEPVPLQAPLVGVSGSSPDDVWAVGASSILRFRGTRWEQVYEYAGTTPASITFASIWATQPDNVLAIAKDDNAMIVLVRYASVDGGAPRFYEVPTNVRSSSLWVTPSADAAWIAANNGTLTRIYENGTGGIGRDDFVPKASPSDTKNYMWTSVWGFAPDDVYAAGKEGSLFGGMLKAPPLLAHFDGEAWTITVLPFPDEMSIDGLTGTPAAGQRRLWLSTTEPGPGGPMSGIALLPVEDGAIGDVLLRQQVTALSPCGSKIAWPVSETTTWMSNGKAVCRWDGTKLEPVSTSLGGLPTGLVRSIWAASKDEAWIVGEAVPQGVGFPTTGFAARRTKASGASQP